MCRQIQSSRRKIFSPPLRGAFLPQRGGRGEWKRVENASGNVDAIALTSYHAAKKVFTNNSRIKMMDEEGFQHSIRTTMQLKTNGELLHIWRENNRAEWTDAAFDVVREMLFQRLGKVPEQKAPNFRRSGQPELTLHRGSKKHPVLNWLVRIDRWSYFSARFVFSFCVFRGRGSIHLSQRFIRFHPAFPHHVRDLHDPPS